MDKKNSKGPEKEKPTWDWTHVQCYLKTVQTNRKSTIWNLSPSIILTNPSTDTSGPNVRLYIDTQKSLQYSNELGWNWHKSWNIPNISLRLQIKDQNTGDFLLAPRNLYAQIFAVKKNTENDKMDRMTLIDVGIRGQSKMEMIDGQVYFSAIKFSSTTYNNEGVNFNLLIVLYINQGQFQKPKVLTAVMSPPIFVDSRRSARDYQQKKFSSFVEPFTYDTLEKEFIKRENKSKSQSQILIRNDPQGFYNYITAPNIRHKVKHPVFLAIKFSNCVKLYYNSKLINLENINDILQNLQTKLLKENKNKPKADIELAINLQDKAFAFVISNLTDSLKRKKVLESIETMQNEFIGISCGPQEVPECMQSFPSIDVLKKSYKDTFEALMTICQNYQPQEQQESEDQYYSDQYNDSQNKSQRKKKEETIRTRNKTTIISNKNPPAPQPPAPQPPVPAAAPATTQKPIKIQKIDEVNPVKEQIYESRFQAPVFLNPQNIDKKPNIATSAFSKAVGFRSVANQNDNNPIFDTSQLNKAFSSNLGNVEFNEKQQRNNQQPKPQGFKTANRQTNLLAGNNHQQINPQQRSLPSLSNPNPNNQNQIPNNFNMNNNFQNNYQNLLYGNLTLSNWLNTVKNNNNGLYDGQMNHSMTDQFVHKNNIQRFMQTQQQQKMLQMNRTPLQNEQQQSILCLIQQIGLYKELLAQVNYQNQLLTRDITMKQQQNNMGQFGGGGGMNFMGIGGPSPINMSNLNNNNMGNTGFANMNGMAMGGLPNGLNGIDPISMQNIMGNNNQHMPSMQNALLGQKRQIPKEKESIQPQAQSKSHLEQKEGPNGLNMNNYEMIKKYVMQEIKREAEQKERQSHENSK